MEESQGKYSSHQIDAIKGIEAVKAASAEAVSRRDAERVSFGVAKAFPVHFHCHVVGQPVTNGGAALNCDFSLGRRELQVFTAISALAVLSPLAR